MEALVSLMEVGISMLFVTVPFLESTPNDKNVSAIYGSLTKRHIRQLPFLAISLFIYGACIAINGK